MARKNKETNMVTVRDLLKVKGNDIWFVSPATTTSLALKMMEDKDVGALLVIENGEVAGIISERDFVRSISSSHMCNLDAPVKNYMTSKVITITSEHTIEDCMQLMTQHRIRHLPVVDGQKAIGMISIGDVVREMISSRESTIVQLENFIQGRGYSQ
jgi:CBS domain-containing protein